MNRRHINKKWLDKFKKLAQKYNVPSDVIDLYSLIDSSLTFDENKKIILEFITSISNKTAEITAEETAKDEIQDKEAELNREYIRRVREEEKKSLETLKGKAPKIEKYFRRMNKYVEMVARGFTDNLIISGRGGVSKSYTTYKKLLDLGLKADDDFIIQSGFSSPLEVYHMLFDYKDDKIIVLDDVEGVLSSEKCCAILKGAMWGVGGQRIIEYRSTSEKLKKPGRAIFNSRLIIILNRIPKLKDVSMEALLSRSVHYPLDFTLSEIKEINYGIAYDSPYKDLTRGERIKVVNAINDLVDESTTNYNIRTLFKGYDIYRYAKNDGWKELLEDLLVSDERRKFVIELLMEKGLREEDRVKKFEDEFGLGRRTYFRLKKDLVRQNEDKSWI